MTDRPYITTSTGSRFYLLDDRPEFRTIEIAHALSMQCRFTGQCERFYSVAEHSVLVSEIMEANGDDPYEGLLHDAAEAYLSDIATPWKTLLPDYKRLEKDLERKVREFYCLPPEITPECKRADSIALLVEARSLLPMGGADLWGHFEHVAKDASAWIDAYHGVYALTPAGAKTAFLHRFEKLTRRFKK